MDNTGNRIDWKRMGRAPLSGRTARILPLPPTETQEAHDMTPTCRAARGAHWTAHSLACKTNRDLVVVQRKAIAMLGLKAVR